MLPCKPLNETALQESPHVRKEYTRRLMDKILHHLNMSRPCGYRCLHPPLPPDSMLGSQRGGARFWPFVPPSRRTTAHTPILKWEREGMYLSTKTGARFLPSTVLYSLAIPMTTMSTNTHTHIYIYIHTPYVLRCASPAARPLTCTCDNCCILHAYTEARTQ